MATKRKNTRSTKSIPTKFRTLAEVKSSLGNLISNTQHHSSSIDHFSRNLKESVSFDCKRGHCGRFFRTIAFVLTQACGLSFVFDPLGMKEFLHRIKYEKSKMFYCVRNFYLSQFKDKDNNNWDKYYIRFNPRKCYFYIREKKKGLSFFPGVPKRENWHTTLEREIAKIEKNFMEEMKNLRCYNWSKWSDTEFDIENITGRKVDGKTVYYEVEWRCFYGYKYRKSWVEEKYIFGRDLQDKYEELHELIKRKELRGADGKIIPIPEYEEPDRPFNLESSQSLLHYTDEEKKTASRSNGRDHEQEDEDANNENLDCDNESEQVFDQSSIVPGSSRPTAENQSADLEEQELFQENLVSTSQIAVANSGIVNYSIFDLDNDDLNDFGINFS